MSAETAGMDDLTPTERREFEAFSHELSQVGRRHELTNARLIQGYLHFGAKLADELGYEFTIDGTDVEVSEKE